VEEPCWARERWEERSASTSGSEEGGVDGWLVELRERVLAEGERTFGGRAEGDFNGGVGDEMVGLRFELRLPRTLPPPRTRLDIVSQRDSHG